jgi:hypothetical protein
MRLLSGRGQLGYSKLLLPLDKLTSFIVFVTSESSQNSLRLINITHWIPLLQCQNRDCLDAKFTESFWTDWIGWLLLHQHRIRSRIRPLPHLGTSIISTSTSLRKRLIGHLAAATSTSQWRPFYCDLAQNLTHTDLTSVLCYDILMSSRINRKFDLPMCTPLTQLYFNHIYAFMRYRVGHVLSLSRLVLFHHYSDSIDVTKLIDMFTPFLVPALPVKLPPRYGHRRSLTFIRSIIATKL